MRIVVAAVMAAALVTGCVSARGKTVYEKPGITGEQKKADEARCTQAAIDAAEGPRGSAFLAVDRDAVDRCMRALGYRATAPR
jgi:hypothetical protein